MTTNVAITGHTTGIGKEIFDFYTNLGANTLGFSRSNGFDLRNWTSMQLMLDQMSTVDLIVSSAKPDFFQAVFLYEFSKRQNFNTKIVSIGSQIVNTKLNNSIDIGINLYKTQKLALQNAHHQLTEKFPRLKSLLIHPSHLYDSDGAQYTDITEWVKQLHNIISNNSSLEVYVS